MHHRKRDFRYINQPLISSKQMQKKELSVWSLLIGAMLLGSIVSVTLGGCRPSTITHVDTTTGNTTAADSNVTAVSPSVAPETPVDTVTSEVDSAETGDDDSSSESSSADGAETQAAPTQLVALIEEAVKPEDILNAGGDWPQWGGTRERNNVAGNNRPADQLEHRQV